MKKETKEVIILLIISIIFSCVYQIFVVNVMNNYPSFSIDRSIVVSFITTFIGLHSVFGLKRLYGYIIDNRYKIAGILVIVLTMLNYSGSSIGAFSKMVLEEDKDNTVFGIYRFIRSDEYGIETPLAISQYHSNFEYKSDLMRGTETDMFTIIQVPVKDIVSIGKIFNIGYYFLNSGMALAFLWNIKLIGLVLVSFEMCMLITSKKRYIALAGSIMIAFSGAVQWWFSHGLITMLIFGQLAIVLVDKFLTTDKLKMKIFCAIGIAISAISYIFTFYPPWMISFGYLFFALLIWIILKNRKNYKINYKDILIVFVTVVCITAVFLRYFYLSKDTINIIGNTSYPGDRIETGGRGVSFLFSYLYNFLLPFSNTNLVDTCVLGSFISVFPVPLIMALVYLYKKQKHIEFLLPMIIITVFETIFCISGFPETISKATLFKFVLVERCAVSVALANVYLFLYIISNIEEEMFNIKQAIRITLIIIILVAFVPVPTIFASKGYLYLFSGVLCLLTFLLLNYNDTRYKKVFLATVIILTLIGGITINPITKGTTVITDTDLANKIQDIVSVDSEALWLAEDCIPVIANYMVANGAKTLNSTNIYPNEEFYKAVLGVEVEEYRNIWNRYAYVKMKIDSENSIELLRQDCILVHITPERIKDLNIKYIVSYNDINILEEKGTSLNKLYEKEVSEPINIDDKMVTGIYIYEVER